jgi:hypothetical protein
MSENKRFSEHPKNLLIFLVPLILLVSIFSISVVAAQQSSECNFWCRLVYLFTGKISTTGAVGISIQAACWDNDHDGYGAPCPQHCNISKVCTYDGEDCNDNNAAVHPGATELCNEIDDNCNGHVDEGNVCCGNGVVNPGEQCDGGNCCNTNCTFKSSQSICRAAAGVCDAADYCSGASADCGIDNKHSISTQCNSWNEYGCPWGNSHTDDVGINSRVQYCDGISNDCNGQITSSWNIYQNCGTCTYCSVIGVNSSQQGYAICANSGIDQQCNNVYGCALNSGDNQYTSAFENPSYQYNSQGYCDSSGSCDYAGFGSQCLGRENNWCRPQIAGCNDYCTLGGSDDDQDGLADDCDADCCTNCDNDHDGINDACDTDDDCLNCQDHPDNLDCNDKDNTINACGGVGTHSICSEDPTSDTSAGTCVTCSISNMCEVLTNQNYGHFYCDGTSWQTGTGFDFVCRPSQGVCDMPDYCTGNGACNSADIKNDSSTVCRPSMQQCDAAEYCNGINNDCPADLMAHYSTPCNDGLFCSLSDHCDGLGDCVLLSPKDCSDAVQCTDDSCNEGNDICVNTPNNNNCPADGWYDNGITQWIDDTQCTEKEQKQQENRDYYCDAMQDCLYNIASTQWIDNGNTRNKQDETACDDGNACTTSDNCQSGSCVGGPAPNCDDNNVCTDDSCNTSSGCVYTNNDANSCSNNDVCDGLETCQSGTCTPGIQLNCNDNIPCTDDTCDPLTGCANTPTSSCQCQAAADCPVVDCQIANCIGYACSYTNQQDGTACNDNNACTTSDTCSSGSCVGGPAPNCDDNNVCTDDSCDSILGCTHTANTASCDDSNACTQTDTCQDKSCYGSNPVICPTGCDGNTGFAFTGTCNSLTGCEKINVSSAPDNICNGIDENCNGVADDNYTATPITCGINLCSNTGTLTCINGSIVHDCEELPPVTVYRDADNDSYGNLSDTQAVCTLPYGYVFISGDCNDNDASVNPGTNDICDANDNVINKDCNASNDNLINCRNYCGDDDGDGYVPDGIYKSYDLLHRIVCIFKNPGDCRNNDATVHPGATEICDGADNNCDGIVDERCSATDKKDALATLQSLSSADKKSSEELGKAIKELKDSLGNLNPDGDKHIIWIDSAHIACKHGYKVFEHEKKAVDHLQKITDPSIVPQANSAIAPIVAADRLLAQTAINEAALTKERLKAIEHFNKGEAATNSKKKIQEYRKAWKYVNKHCEKAKESCIDEITVISPDGDEVSAIGDEIGVPDTVLTDINDNQVVIKTDCSKCIQVGDNVKGWTITEIVDDGTLAQKCAKK